MPVQSNVSITGRGTVLIGTVLRGSLNKGDSAELVGYGSNSKYVVTDMQMFGKPQSEVKGVRCL